MMKTIIQVIIVLLFATVNLQAQKVPTDAMTAHTEELQALGPMPAEATAYAFNAVDDPYNEYIQITSPMLETQSNNGEITLHWSISGNIHRQTRERGYSVIWMTVYQPRTYRFYDIDEMRLPGPVIIDAYNARRDSEYSRGYIMSEIWVAPITEDIVTTLDQFRILGDGVTIDCAVPPDYLAGLTDIMIEYSE